jgi:hypothetical protein
MGGVFGPWRSEWLLMSRRERFVTVFVILWIAVTWASLLMFGLMMPGF